MRSRVKTIRIAIFAVAVALAARHAVTKSMIQFGNGLKNAGHSYVTNDTIHIEWVRDPGFEVLVPLNAPVYIDYRLHGSTNQWGMLAQSVVSAGAWDGMLANATNYDYHVFAYYIPPGPVVTNDYWSYRSIVDEERKGIVPLRATFDVDGNPITPQKGEDKE